MGDAPVQYDVCLSFAGEDREYVELVAAGLREHDVRVFYDRYATVELWGKDLYEHLAFVYGEAARYCVLFVSAAYGRKMWTSHERKSAQDRAIRQNREYILPVRFDDAEVPGLLGTIGHVDLRSTAPSELVGLILQKLEEDGRRSAVHRPSAPNRLPGTADGVGETSLKKSSPKGDHSTLDKGLWLPGAFRSRSVAELSTHGWVAGISVALLLCVTVPIALLTAGPGGARASTVQSGALLLKVDPRWRSIGADISGLSLAKGVALVSAGTEIYAGELTHMSKIPAGIPQSLKVAYGEPESDELVRLPFGLARKYTWTRASRGVLSIMLVVTGASEIVIACASSSMAEQRICGSIASRATIRGADIEYPGADPRVAGELSVSLRDRAKRVVGVSALSTKNSLPFRAGALNALARMDASAAGLLAKGPRPERDAMALTALASGLNWEATMLRRLGIAARAANRSLYESLRLRFEQRRMGAAGAVLEAVGFLKLLLPTARLAPASSPRKRRASAMDSGATRVRGTLVEPVSKEQPAYTPSREAESAPVRRAPETITSRPE